MNYKDIIFLTSDAFYGDNLFIASRNKTANPGSLQTCLATGGCAFHSTVRVSCRVILK
jgi:hypothetical protein